MCTVSMYEPWLTVLVQYRLYIQSISLVTVQLIFVVLSTNEVDPYKGGIAGQYVIRHMFGIFTILKTWTGYSFRHFASSDVRICTSTSRNRESCHASMESFKHWIGLWRGGVVIGIWVPGLVGRLNPALLSPCCQSVASSAVSSLGRDLRRNLGNRRRC